MRASALYVQRNWPVRCRKCGAVHHSSGSVISPEMWPLHVSIGYRGFSPWQFHYTRPVKPGEYECDFRDVGSITLWWNGRYFQPSAADSRQVKLGTLKRWRGVWG